MVYASEQIEQDFIDFSRHIEPQLFESISSKESIHFPLPVDDSLKEQVKFISFLLSVKYSAIDWSVTLKSGFSMLHRVNFMQMLIDMKLPCSRSSVSICCLLSKIVQWTYL